MGKSRSSSEETPNAPFKGGAHSNRLIHEKSPYLLQHAHNPVDWFPWGPEAFEKAKKEDKPVFLSIGYSTCHWCHVMEAESFEHEDVAQILNENFVSIKVDREERPDLDEIYMTATQLSTGRGGWPNSVWLTPDGRPWYAGTYFPPEDRQGLPGFKSVLAQLAEAWRTRRAQVEKQADGFAEAMRKASSAAASLPAPSSTKEGAISGELVKAALNELRNSFDERFGGFGDAPKFPPHAALGLLFYEFRLTKDDSLLRMATATLEAMSRGGIHDHVGGGFHRYSTDARWFLPHFEKMLYDNAQLARAYSGAFLLTGNEEYRATAMDTCDWVLREMTDPAGGFYSALDADSEGVEGKFYVWTREEILAVLGAEEGDAFCRIYGVEEKGNFRSEATGRVSAANVLYLRGPLDKLAEAAGMPSAGSSSLTAAPRREPLGRAMSMVERAEGLRARVDDDRKKLLLRRDGRVRPQCDDKVLAGWNGLMIGGLAFAGKHLDVPRYTTAAERAAGFVLTAMRKDGRLFRSFRRGKLPARPDAYLDDYAFLADGLLDLCDATGDRRWLDEAKSLMAVLKAHYWDEARGGYFLTPDDGENLLLRLKPSYDQATPSGNGVAARVLIRLGRLTGDAEYFETARATLNSFLGLMQSVPQATHSLILATAMLREAKPAGGIAAQKPVAVEASPAAVKVAAGRSCDVTLRIAIAKGYHINSHQPLEAYLVPTELTLDGKNVASLRKVTYPAGTEKNFGFSEKPLSVYEGTVAIRAQISIARDAAPGIVQTVMNLRVQPCSDESCLAPEVISVPLALEVSSAATGR